jgi:hypothetical protein
MKKILLTLTLSLFSSLPFGAFATEHEIEIPPSTFSNVWIQPNIDEQQEYLFDSQKRLNQFCDQYLGLIEKNSENIALSFYTWYDSNRTTQQQLLNTQSYLEHYAQDEDVSIIFRDIREIDLVQDNADIFSIETPKYIFSDAIREVILDYLCRTEFNARYHFYGDMNIPAFSLRELLLGTSKIGMGTVLESFNEEGLILCQAAESETFFDHENAFIGLDSQNEDMIFAHRLGIIDINLIRWRDTFGPTYASLQKQLDNVRAIEERGINSLSPQGSFYLFNLLQTYSVKTLSGLRDSIKANQERCQEIFYSSYPHMMKLYYFIKGTCGLNQPIEEITETLIEERREYAANNLQTIFNPAGPIIACDCYYNGPIIRFDDNDLNAEEGKLAPMDLISLNHLTVDVQKPNSHYYDREWSS